jgi:hypothetical protein
MIQERPSFDPSIVDGSNVYDYDREDYWIATGVDSQVFHLGDWVLKKYNARGPSVEQVCLYKEVTNLVAHWFQGYKADLGFFGKVVLEVEPIIKVFASDKYKQAFSVSRYIEGRHLMDGQNKTFDSFLEGISYEMIEATGYDGIELRASNAKLTRINNGLFIFASSKCIITDICCSIDHLRPK